MRQVITKIIGLVLLTLIIIPSANAIIDEKKAAKTKVKNDKDCIPEEGVVSKVSESYDKLQTDDLESLLSGNTLVSVDRWGTFIIYYPDNKNTVAWMPKIKSKNTIEDWNIGTVTFENNKYCRQWTHWRSGKNINCWNAFEVENRVDKRAFLFTCRKGTPDGDQHIVFQGNIFNVKYEGTDNTNGTLIQDNQKVKEVLEKYFANYSK